MRKGGVPVRGGPCPGAGAQAARPAAWQSPYLNVFKHFRVEEWKRSAKEGDVTACLVTGGHRGDSPCPGCKLWAPPPCTHCPGSRRTRG